MADQKGTTTQRLTQIRDFLTMNKTATTIPWDPDSTRFPTRKELPQIAGAPAGAAWVWGENDFVGRLNLLTPSRVAAAAKEIRTGEIVPVKYVAKNHSKGNVHLLQSSFQPTSRSPYPTRVRPATLSSRDQNPC